MGLNTDYEVPFSKLLTGTNSQIADSTNTPLPFFNIPCVFDNMPVTYISSNPFSNASFPLQTGFLPSTIQFPNLFFNMSSFNFQNQYPLLNFASWPLNYSNLTSLPLTTDTFIKSNSTKPSNALSASAQSYYNPKITNNPKINLSWWKAQGYNEQKGKELAANTKKHSDNLYRQGIKAQCGRGVRLGINDTYYNGEQHYERFGQARLTGDVTLSNDSNFKKINVKGLSLSKEDIPAGAIVIYEAGYSRGKYSYCGHIEVADGNGHGYSDFTSTLLQNNGVRKEPKEIWIPV